MSIKEFAARIGVHSNTVRRGIKSGRWNAFRVNIGPKCNYRIPISEIHRVAIVDFEKVIEILIDKALHPELKK
jgi:excisionase family DNA binding protein